MITSLKPDAFRAADVLALYRLRWRIELGFKRLKSLIGLKSPPENDERSARAYVLAHLLVILLLEPHISAFEDSPRWAAVARPGPAPGVCCVNSSQRCSRPLSPSQQSSACGDPWLYFDVTSMNRPDDGTIKI